MRISTQLNGLATDQGLARALLSASRGSAPAPAATPGAPARRPARAVARLPRLPFNPPVPSRAERHPVPPCTKRRASSSSAAWCSRPMPGTVAPSRRVSGHRVNPSGVARSSNRLVTSASRHQGRRHIAARPTRYGICTAKCSRNAKNPLVANGQSRSSQSRRTRTNKSPDPANETSSPSSASATGPTGA